MPTSETVSFCRDLLLRIRPRRVLDISAGSHLGWGVIAYEVSEARGVPASVLDWDCTVDGIAPVARPGAELQGRIYHHLFRGDACRVLENLDHYDLTILGDVTEPLPDRRGCRILEKAVGHSAFVLLLARTSDRGSAETERRKGFRDDQRTTITGRELHRSARWRIVAHRLPKRRAGARLAAFLLRAPHLGIPAALR